MAFVDFSFTIHDIMTTKMDETNVMNSASAHV